MKKFVKFIGYLAMIFGALALIYEGFFKKDSEDTDKPDAEMEKIPHKREYITLDME